MSLDKRDYDNLLELIRKAKAKIPTDFKQANKEINELIMARKDETKLKKILEREFAFVFR